MSAPASPDGSGSGSVEAPRDPCWGVWVDGFGTGVRTPDEVADLVEFAHTAGLDTLVVQVTRRGDALANELPLPRADADLAPPPFDPLAAVCEAARPAGIAVHAWLAVTPVAQRAAPPSWAVPMLCRRLDGTDSDRHGIAHLDPGHPETGTTIAEIARATVANYPVDGVSLDRVRYPEVAHDDPSQHGTALWGANLVALERFRDEAGRDLEGPHDPLWQDWRRRQVGAIVDTVAEAVRGARSDATVSVNGCCHGGLGGGWVASRPYTELGQDWVGWLTEGRVDRVLAMNYRGDADDAGLVRFGDLPDDVAATTEGAAAVLAPRAALDQRWTDWAALAIRAGSSRTVLGTGCYLQSVAASAREAIRSLDLRVDGAGAGGWCGFSYRTPSRVALHDPEVAPRERARLAAALNHPR
ncbi:hypothetical protein ER308_06470 [Egibacter rhizosphaerae]|uniref:Glycosyl hydrolase-like 10 domain-containing protein n=1 Tax=Egibacter rhizosphaerae TaxID=1670831 RepID=A0A411YDG0_9ACTN|nr:family 10 glycosylhydrolase [Egibacter rhizosphaerae]QBI19218.1 hypothetical protein ER308_06470 [Egibacter rhizosphaerae]